MSRRRRDLGEREKGGKTRRRLTILQEKTLAFSAARIPLSSANQALLSASLRYSFSKGSLSGARKRGTQCPCTRWLHLASLVSRRNEGFFLRTIKLSHTHTCTRSDRSSGLSSKWRHDMELLRERIKAVVRENARKKRGRGCERAKEGGGQKKCGVEGVRSKEEKPRRLSRTWLLFFFFFPAFLSRPAAPFSPCSFPMKKAMQRPSTHLFYKFF